MVFAPLSYVTPKFYVTPPDEHGSYEPQDIPMNAPLRVHTFIKTKILGHLMDIKERREDEALLSHFEKTQDLDAITQGPDPLRVLNIRNEIAAQFEKIQNYARKSDDLPGYVGQAAKTFSESKSSQRKQEIEEELVGLAWGYRYLGRLDEPQLNDRAKRHLAAQKVAMEELLDASPQLRARVNEYASIIEPALLAGKSTAENKDRSR